MPVSPSQIIQGLSDVPVQAILSSFEYAKKNSGIPTVATKAEVHALQSTTADIGVFDMGVSLVPADYAAHKSSFKATTIPVVKKQYITQIDLLSYIRENLGEYRTDEGGYTEEAIMALCSFIGEEISKKYLQVVMSGLQANLVAQLAPYPANYEVGQAGLIDWVLTHTVADAGKTKIIDLINAKTILMPSEMKPGGALAEFLVAYVSQGNFDTMRKSSVDAYQQNPTGGFESGRDIYTRSGQISIEQAQVMNAKQDNCYILLGNIVFIPLVELQDDTLLLTYQKREGKTMYYEKIPAVNYQNLYFGVQGMFAHDPKLTTDVKGAVTGPYSLPLRAGGMFLSNPDTYNPLTHLLNFFMGASIIVQDPSRLYAIFPNP